MADNIVYGATGLTGGTDHDLDGYDGAGLVENDMAVVIDDNNYYVYTLKADSQAESSPVAPGCQPDLLGVFWAKYPQAGRRSRTIRECLLVSVP